jgi:hypothetical protein
MNRRTGKSAAVIVGIVLSLMVAAWVVYEVVEISNGQEYPHSHPNREMKVDGTLGE